MHKRKHNRNRNGVRCRLSLEALETRTMLSADMLAAGQILMGLVTESPGHIETLTAVRPAEIAIEAVRSANIEGDVAFLPPTSMPWTDLPIPAPLPVQTIDHEPVAVANHEPPGVSELPRDELQSPLQSGMFTAEVHPKGLPTPWELSAENWDEWRPSIRPQIPDRSVERPDDRIAPVFSLDLNGAASRRSSPFGPLSQPAATLFVDSDLIEQLDANATAGTTGQTGLANDSFPHIESTPPASDLGRIESERSEGWSHRIVRPWGSWTRFDSLDAKTDMDGGLIDIDDDTSTVMSTSEEFDRLRESSEEGQPHDSNRTDWLDLTWRNLDRAQLPPNPLPDTQAADPTESDTHRQQEHQQEGGLIELLASNASNNVSWSVAAVMDVDQVQMDGALGLFQEIEVAIDAPLPIDNVADRDAANDADEAASEDVQAAMDVPSLPLRAVASPFAFIGAAAAFAMGRKSKDKSILDKCQSSEDVL